jgi:NTP pyrophosphatase (non-canonical NTP hydrolase)
MADDSLTDLTRLMLDFVQSKGWLEADSAHPQTPKNIALSLVLEASEVLEHFQWGEQAENPEELAGELADVLLYLMQLAHLHDIDLSAAVRSKLSHNKDRRW